MPIRVQVPGHGIVEFPDGTAQDVMKNAITHLNSHAKPVSEDEPGDYWGGFRKGLTDYAMDVMKPKDPHDSGMPFNQAVGPKLKGMMSTPLAHPTGIDFIDGLTSPGSLAMLATAGAGLVSNPAARGTVGRGLRAIGDIDITHPFRSTIGAAGEALERSATAAGDRAVMQDRYLPNKSGIPDSGIPQGEMPTPTPPVEVDRYLPNSGGQPAVESPSSTSRVPYARPQESVNTAPIGPETIDEMLQDLMTKDAPVDSRITGVPPDAGTVGEGSLKQSGKFGKSQSLGQAGGYSSGRPATNNYDAIVEGAGGEGRTHGYDPLQNPLTETQPIDVTQATANVEMSPQRRALEELQQRGKVGSGGAELSPGPEDAGNSAGNSVETGTPTTSTDPMSVDDLAAKMAGGEYDPGGMADRAQNLRANVGSRDAAREMFGSATPDTQGAIRTMAPGPSRIPNEAQGRIDAEGRGDSLLMELLQSLGIKRTP